MTTVVCGSPMRKSGQFEFVFKDPETVETISMRSPIERPPLPHPQSSRIHDFVRRDLLFDGVLKIGCIWPKPVVFGQNGCVWAKWLVRSLVSGTKISFVSVSRGWNLCGQKERNFSSCYILCCRLGKTFLVFFLKLVLN